MTYKQLFDSFKDPIPYNGMSYEYFYSEEHKAFYVLLYANKLTFVDNFGFKTLMVIPQPNTATLVLLEYTSIFKTDESIMLELLHRIIDLAPDMARRV